MPNHLPVTPDAIAPESGSSYPEPFKSRLGQGTWRALGDHFGLTQYGVNFETLQPGAQSAARHWHTLSDEFIYMLAGELILITDDGETQMLPGMSIGFKAGDKNAHHLVNRSAQPANFLVVGTRTPGDSAFYPDDDLAWFYTENGRIAVHKDGSPYIMDRADSTANTDSKDSNGAAVEV